LLERGWGTLRLGVDLPPGVDFFERSCPGDELMRLYFLLGMAEDPEQIDDDCFDEDYRLSMNCFELSVEWMLLCTLWCTVWFRPL